MYGSNKKDLVEIIKKALRNERSPAHRGKSAPMFYDRHPESRTKWGDRHLWARGYYVATVGNVNEETIRKYIHEQEENDKLGETNK